MEQEITTKKPWHKRKWIWIVGIIFVLYIIGSSSSSPTSEVDATKTDSKDEVHAVGESIVIGKSAITVNNVSFSQGGQFTKPQSGNEWINLNITIENTSSSQQFVTTLGQMFVRDSNGNSYQVAVTDKTIEDMNSRLDGAIIAQSKRTGWVGFEIPNGATGLQFEYKGSLWTGGAVVVDLGR